VAEESQTPGLDRLSDRRLSGTGTMNYLVGNVGGKWNLQNVSKVPRIKRIKSLVGLHHHIPIYLEPIISTTAGDTDLVPMKHL